MALVAALAASPRSTPFPPDRPRTVQVRYLIWIGALALALKAVRDVRAARAHLRSLLIRSLCRVVNARVSRERLRTQFAEQAMPQARSPDTHTHPHSAAMRSNASSMFASMYACVGLRPQYVSMSPSDQRLQRAGSREYYWPKDLAAEPSRFDDNAESYAFVDVDYYVDMPRFLAEHHVPVALFGFAPSTASNARGEASHTFHSDNTVEYKVSGGANYRHHLWSYSDDTITASHRSWWGWKTCVVYNVDRRQVDETHQAVMLTPIARSSCWLIGLDDFLEWPALRRFEPNDGAFTRIWAQGRTGLTVSTAASGQYISATVSAEADSAVRAVAMASKLDLTTAQVRTTLGEEDSGPGPAAVLAAYHRQKTVMTRAAMAYPVVERVVAFQPARGADYDSKAAMQAFMSPLCTGAVVPMVNAANEAASITGRVLGVMNPELKINNFLYKCIEEFAAIAIPQGVAGSLFPTDIDEVFERQPRPPQQRILTEAAAIGGLSGDGSVLQTFLKKESYAAATDPRNITTFGGTDKLEYSRYIYAYAEHHRTRSWYAFGKSPRGIAEEVGRIAARARMLAMTDLSRCDGRMSNVSRMLEKVLMLRAFHHSVHGAMLDAMDRQHHRRARGAFGTRYNTGDTRCSGSTETADFNTDTSAFLGFLAARYAGFTPIDAEKFLGVYGGDDGLAPLELLDVPGTITPEDYRRAATALGQVIELDVVHRGQRGVNFLARYYTPHVWTGASDSMADVRRQLIKMHLTVHLPADVKPLQKLVEKSHSLMCTDANTPVLGALARAVLSRHREGAPLHRRELWQWHARELEAERYPNENDGWMEDEFDHNFPTFDRHAFAAWVAGVEAGALDPLTPPLFALDPIKTKAPFRAVVGEDVLPAAAATAPPPPLAGPAPPRDMLKPCYRAARGKCTNAQCPYSHDEAVLKAVTRGCGDFRRGKCNRGDKCKFEHTAASPGSNRA